MNDQQLADRHFARRSRQVSRRSFNAGILAPVVGAALLPLGCRRSIRSGSASEPLNLLAWSEYVPPAVIDGFTKETGIKVSYATYSSNEEMLSKLLAGGTKYDLIQPSEYTVEALVRQSKLAPLNFDRIPNLANIAPDMLHLPYDPEQKYSVPYMSGTVGIVVNTHKVAKPVRGYRGVFRPEHRGRIVVVDDPREMVSWAMNTLGLNINEVTPQALERVKPVLANWIPLIQAFNSDSPKTPLIDGDVDLGVVFSGDAAICYQQDRKFQYVLPEEGAHRFIDNLCVPTGAPHQATAEQFINYILRPDVSRLISDKFPYTNPNLAARKLLTADQLANPASYPPTAGKLETFRDIGAMSSEVDKMVTDLRVKYGR